MRRQARRWAGGSIELADGAEVSEAMDRQPTVSCVMPVRNGRRFVSQAIWYFLRQDYAPRELIVVDDGVDSVAELVPNDRRLRYVRLDHPTTGAAKRNLGCELSSGELIASWDDDVWYSPVRLSSQIAHLQHSGAQLAALSGLLHYQPLSGRIWRYDAAARSTVGLHGGALVYRRSCWANNRFDERRHDELTAFVGAIPQHDMHIRPGAELAVALLQGSNTRPVNPADPKWQPRPFDELGRILELDARFYAELRNADRAAHGPAPATITLAATFMVYDGYGSMAEYLALGMARAGADVQVAPLRIDPTAMSQEFKQLLERSRPDPNGIVLCHAWWGENLARFGSAGDLFVKTVWETSRLPADWPARLNQTRAVVVPSRFSAHVFRQSGVRVPVEVAYEGVDPEVYPYCERPVRSGLTTLVVGVLAARKNFRQAIAAWKRAFADDPDARLVLKARFQVEPYVPDDPRIVVVDSNEATRGIAHWYRQADVLLALGNEGFGLPVIEGMATGLPVVALDSEAQGDVCAEAAGMLLPVRPARWEDVNGAPFGPCGVRAIPDVEDAAHKLRWVAEHREQAREMGRRASAWAHERRNVWQLGPTVLAALERHARSPRPLRRSYAQWAPARASEQAFGYYCADLYRVLPLARVYERPPASWRSQALHIQHRPGVYDELALARQIQAAQHDGVAVIVTEHSVAECAHAWEQRADALVALSEDAAARLRLRWPGKRVELIPPGCPAWRRPVRAGVGNVVALLGAFRPDGAAYQLVDALSRVPGAQLLVFGPRAQGAGDWARTTRGLATRYVELPPSGDDLAGYLNEAADVAVLWGNDARRGPSYTARIALASGLPVLAGRAAEHADLAAATFQPDDLAAGLCDVLSSRARRAELAAAARAFCDQASWPRVAAVHHALWQTLAP